MQSYGWGSGDWENCLLYCYSSPPLPIKSTQVAEGVDKIFLPLAAVQAASQMMDYFPGQSFFQTRCTTIDGQLLYNFLNKKTLYFTLP
jgi:hypothetical protein